MDPQPTAQKENEELLEDANKLSQAVGDLSDQLEKQTTEISRLSAKQTKDTKPRRPHEKWQGFDIKKPKSYKGSSQEQVGVKYIVYVSMVDPEHEDIVKASMLPSCLAGRATCWYYALDPALWRIGMLCT